MLQTKTFTLLTIDLSMFGEGGEASAPAAAEAPATEPEVRYGKQPEQTAAPQQEAQNPAPVDKGKQFRDMIRGEWKDQYAEESQKLINRRFRETDERIKAQQPIIDLLAQRYGVKDGDMGKLMTALEGDNAYWQEAAEEAGMSVQQYQQFKKLEAANQQLIRAQQSQQQQYLASRQYAKWEQEAEKLKTIYPDFNLEAMMGNDLFALMLRNNYPMQQAYEASSVGELTAKAAAGAERAVTENIRARGARPAEAGAAATPAFTVKDDVSQLSDEDVLKVLAQISNGRKVTFG